MHIKSKLLALAAGVMLVAGTGAAAVTAGGAAASTSGAPLPAYPATTTLDLGSPNCVTDDVIMNDPIDSTSPITDTADGSKGAGNPVVFPHATPPIKYYLWWLNPSNVWTVGAPPGVQINSVTGELAAYGPAAPLLPGPDWSGTPAVVVGTGTFTVREHGKDSYGLGAVGTEQYQVSVTDTGSVTTLKYEGNTFNNANGALTIQLNGGSTTSTTLTLSAIASSLNIPGSTPVTFTLLPSSYPAWKLNGGTTGTVLTGVGASDPNIEATTANHDVVFFHLSGLSTDSGGVFFTNTDANPCVGGTPAPAPTPTGTGTPPPPPSGVVGEISSFTDYSYSCLDNSDFHWTAGNPVQLWQCGAAGGADQQFTLATVGGHEVLEAVAPSGKPPGPWCVTDEGAGARLLIESCTGTGGQVISKQGSYYVFADGLVMNDAGWNANNGAWVIAYQNVGTRNERWSLP